MKLNNKKALIARMLGVGKSRVFIDNNRLNEIKEAITKADLRSLVKKGVIGKTPVRGISRYRIREKRLLKRRGRRVGIGGRKGNKTARNPPKKLWMIKIRLQREFLRVLKEKGLVSTEIYRKLYMMAKSGFFKSRRHLKIYIEERSLIKK
jgi:large subunit ribosomal protein L19e